MSMLFTVESASNSSTLTGLVGDFCFIISLSGSFSSSDLEINVFFRMIFLGVGFFRFEDIRSCRVGFKRSLCFSAGFSLSSTGKLGRVVELVWAAESLLGLSQVHPFTSPIARHDSRTAPP